MVFAGSFRSPTTIMKMKMKKTEAEISHILFCLLDSTFLAFPSIFRPIFFVLVLSFFPMDGGNINLRKYQHIYIMFSWCYIYILIV